jgi:hypothetical protein
MTPIHFVFSAPRSGSTWLAKALNHHPEIFATEHRLFGQFCEIWPNNDGTHSPRITFDSYAEAMGMHYLFSDMGMSRPEFLEAFQKSYINFLAGFGTRRSGKSMVVDKVTPYLGTCELALNQVQLLMPESKMILLMRDGRDVLTSGTFDWLQRESGESERHQYLVAKTLKAPPKRFFDDEVIQQWAEHWREVAFFGAKSNPAGVISYEQMKSDHALELQKLFRMLEVDAEISLAQNCAEATTFEKTTGRAAGDQRSMAKARKGIAGDWKNFFTQTDGRLFCQIAGEELVKFGYESNNDWVDDLPEVLSWNQDLLG